MSLTVNDLQPKPFIINIKGVDLKCHPLRLSHALRVSKLGNLFQNADKASADDIVKAEAEMDAVIAELIPELHGIKLDLSATMQVIDQMMGQIEPEDNKELKDKGVSFDTDPKA